MKSWIIIIISFALSFAYGVFTQARQKRLETLEANERYTRLSELNHTYSGFTFNEAQRELVNRYSVLYQCLPEPERLRVEAMAHVFMAEVEFVAMAGTGSFLRTVCRAGFLYFCFALPHYFQDSYYWFFFTGCYADI